MYIDLFKVHLSRKNYVDLSVFYRYNIDYHRYNIDHLFIINKCRLLLCNFNRNFILNTFKYDRYNVCISRDEYILRLSNNYVYNASISFKKSISRPKYNEYDYLDLDFSVLSIDYVDDINGESWD